MMTPRSPSSKGSAASMSAAARRSRLKLPIKFTLMTFSKSSSAIGPPRPTMRLAGAMPAQLTRTRAAPCASRARDRGLGLGSAGHVAGEAEPVHFLGDRRGALGVDVEHADLGARRGQVARGLRAQARAAAGDDGAVSPYVHSFLSPPFFASERKTGAL